MKKLFSLITIIGLLASTTLQAAYVQPPYPAAKGGTGSASTPSSGQVMFGNAGGTAYAPQSVSGDLSAASTGAMTVVAGAIDNAKVSATAAIAYSKLNLAASIVNADIAVGAAIAYAKLNLSASIVNADVAAGAAIAFSKLASLTSGHLLVGSAGNVATDVALSGDATLVASGALTLATVNGNVGSFTNANITVNAKGLITAASNGTTPNITVVDGGDAAYTILAADRHVRSGTTLTAQRAYTLPACVANIGEQHEVKNVPGQTFNIVLTADGSDLIDGSATVVVAPGDSVPVVCAVSGTWDIQ